MIDNFQFRLKSEDVREFEQKVQNARSRAIRYIGLGRKASGRIEAFLQEEGFEADVIRTVLSELTADRYIDDERLVRRQVRTRSGAKSESSARLAVRLAQSGLNPTAIEAVLTDLPSDKEAARAALAGRFNRIIDPADLMTQRIKMQRFLASRGFSADIARDAVRDYLKGIPDDE